MHRWALACVALAACGRIGFDASVSGDSGAGDGALIDAPPVPAQVCALHQIPLAAGLVPAHADLAAAAAGGTITLLWADADATGGRPPWGARVDTTTFAATLPPAQLVGLPATNEIGGVRDLGSFVEYEWALGGQMEVDELSESLASPSVARPLATTVAARDGIVRSNTLSAYATLFGNGPLYFAAVQADGTIDAPQSYTPGASDVIGELACDDGPDHVHVGFRVDPGGPPSSCTIGSVYFSSPSVMYLGPTFALPGDCREVRVAASADATDNLFGFYQIASGELDAMWVSGSGTTTPAYTVTTSGRAPRTRYDGTVYRIAWLDTTSGDEMYIGEYPPGGAVTQTNLHGWTPAGDNGFTLLRDGNLVWLVILSPTELSFLQLCQ